MTTKAVFSGPRTEIWSILLVLSFSVAVLAAGIYIGLFNDLSFDDMRRVTDRGRGWFKKLINFEVGRFVNGLIVLNPFLYDLSVYRSLHIVNIVVWTLSLWMFVYSYLEQFDLANTGRACLYITASFFLVMTTNAPNLGEWWFWFAASSVHMLGSALFLLGHGFLLKALRSRKGRHWVMASLVLFLCAGNNEQTLLVCLITCAAIALVYFQRGSYWPVLPLASVLVAVVVVISFPGTNSRLEAVTGDGLLVQMKSRIIPVFSEVIPTLWGGIKYWTNDLLWLVLGLCSFLVAATVTRSRTSQPTMAMILFVLGISIVALFAIAGMVVILEWRVNINDTSRFNNVAYSMFLLAVTLNCFNLGLYATSRWGKPLPAQGVLQTAILILTLALCVFSMQTYNVRMAAEDIRFNRPARQAASIRHWDEIFESAKASGARDIVVPNMIPAHTLTVHRYGPKLDPTYNHNKKWMFYKGLEGRKFTSRHFDRELLEAVHGAHQPLDAPYNLAAYRDPYRNYVLTQVREGTTDPEPMCVVLHGNNGAPIETVTWDETHRNLTFPWHDGMHCTDFVSRKLYCEPYRESWFCRIPLPLEFTGTATVRWGDHEQDILIK